MSKIVLPSDLQTLTLTELWGLYAKAERELMQSAASSAARRDALASLENIRRAIHGCAAQSKVPSPRI